MLNKKTLIITITALLLVAPATADLKFKDPNNVTFYTGLEFNGNQQIYGLGKPTASNSPVRRTDLADYLNRSKGTLAGELDFDGYNAELSGGYISNDGDKEGIQVKNSGDVLVKNGKLNLSGNTITNLGEPVENKDAARLQDIGNGTVNRSGDTMAGNLSFNNQYYITDIKDPESSQDAATKNYVDINTQTLTETDIEDFIFDTGDNTGNLGLNGGEIQDNFGNITLNGDSEISNGNLELNSNNITNPNCIGDQC